MKQEDNDIKEFFERLQETDRLEAEIPSFNLPEAPPKPKRSVLRYLLPLGVAASLLLFFGIDWGPHNTSIEDETLVITMTIEESNTTDDFLSDETSISSWKSPSDILIQEFED